MTPAERDDDVRGRALRRAFARLSGRWYGVLTAALAAGCVVALVFRLVVSGHSWQTTAQGMGFFVGLVGVVMGLMLAYGGRASLGAAHRDARGERLRGVSYPARPVAGLAEALFCAPIVITTLTM